MALHYKAIWYLLVSQLDDFSGRCLRLFFGEDGHTLHRHVIFLIFSCYFFHFSWTNLVRTVEVMFSIHFSKKFDIRGRDVHSKLL